MAYVKNTWVDREGTTRYHETVDEDGALIFTPDYEKVTEIGTPVNADNMNHIEEGIAAGSFTKYDLKATYALNDLITIIEDGAPTIYKSLQDNNIGNALSDSAYWEKISLGSGSGFNLFDTKISDHVLTGEEAKGWALQGSYVNGAVYPTFYAKCLEEFNGATNTETINGVIVKIHSNGHKFYNISDKTAIDEFFNTIGSAWFYGVDTENERIFLPRDNFFAIKGIAPVVGNGMALGITDGTDSHPVVQDMVGSNNDDYGLTASTSALGSPVGSASAGYASDMNGVLVGITTDPTKSGIEAHLETNEDKYLYICVGNTIVNEDQIDVSKVLSEAVLRSSLEEIQTVIETYVNGTSWYRVWSDGWCEQGGRVSVSQDSNVTVTFLKPFANTDYYANWISCNGVVASGSGTRGADTLKTTSMRIYNGQDVAMTANWQACGYIW